LLCKAVIGAVLLCCWGGILKQFVRFCTLLEGDGVSCKIEKKKTNHW
jgi:hypothetical protein